MILVIQTQDYENYAAHGGFDGSFYWKAKGGSEIKVTGVDPTLYTEEQIVEMARELIEVNNEYFQTEIIGAGFEADDYLSWFEKSQLEYDGTIQFSEPTMEFSDIVARWLKLDDPMLFANQSADADAEYFGYHGA